MITNKEADFFCTSQAALQRLWLAVLAWGIMLRIAPLAIQYFWHGYIPRFHSGGLFYAFSSALHANHYALPVRILHYTLGGIPFVYPPLGFYLTGALLEFSAWNPAAMLFLNAALSCGALFAFNFVCLRAELTYPERIWALAVFATLPEGFLEHLPGEGLAESLGTLMLSVFCAFLLKCELPGSRWLPLSLGVALGLSVMSSPGTAYAAPVSLIIYFFVRMFCSKLTPERAFLLRRFLLIVTISLICAGYYIWSVIAHHGLSAVLASFASQQSHHPLIILLSIKLNMLSAVWAFPLWHILGCLGIFDAVRKRDIFWVVWPLFLASVSREGIWLTVLPISILAARGTFRVLMSALQALLERALTVFVGANPATLSKLFLVGILSYSGVIAPVLAMIKFDDMNLGDFFYTNYVSDDELEVLRSVRSITEKNASLLIVGNEIEWAPVLSERTVLNVWYGTEWMPSKTAPIEEYNYRISVASSAYELKQILVYMYSSYPEIFTVPDYIYLSRLNLNNRHSPALKAELLDSLSSSPCFPPKFESAAASLLRFAPELCD